MAKKTIGSTTVGGAGKSLDEFRQKHDKNYIVPARIRQGLVDLGEAWEYEGEFIRRTGVSQTDIALFREQFEEHIVMAGGMASGRSSKRVWCGTVEFAAKLREVA